MSDKQLPVNWEERLSSEAKAVSAIERPSVSIISTRAGCLTYMGQPVPGNKLDVIILAAVFERNWFSQDFDSENPRNPSCFSFSMDGDNMVPHEKSEDPQGPICESCELNIWGSGKGRGKACKEIRKLAMLPASALQNGIAKAELAILRIPVTSVRNWSNYVNQVATSVRRPPWAVVTQIGLTPDPKRQFSVNFEAIGTISEDSLLTDINNRIKGALESLTTPYDPNVEKEEAEKKEEGKPKKNRKY